MGLRGRILLAQVLSLTLVSAGVILGLLAGNLVWRRSHERVLQLEHQIQTVDLLSIRLRQAIPSMAQDRAVSQDHHLPNHLDQSVAALQAFLMQLRRNELSESADLLDADLARSLTRLLRQGEMFAGELKAARELLGLNPGSQSALAEAHAALLDSPALRALWDSEQHLEAMRDARFASLREARGQEKQAETLELAIPLMATGVAGALGLALAWQTSRTMLLPLRRLNSHIEELRAGGSLEVEPLDQEGRLPSEIQSLTDNFNRLVERLGAVLGQLETLSLTKVGNRRHFDQSLAAEVARHRRQGRELALLLLDLDHFKAFNDLYGHPHGDGCLIQLAQALSGLFRRPGELICRIGGEEFAVLLPDTSRDEALRQAGRILTAIEALAIEHGANPPLRRVSVSVGVSSGKPGETLTGTHLVEAADRALYKCKRDLGRNTVAVAEPLERRAPEPPDRHGEEPRKADHPPAAASQAGC